MDKVKPRRPDLSGVVLRRFLARVLAGEGDLPEPVRARLIGRLEAEIASLRPRRATEETAVAPLSGEPVAGSATARAPTAPPASTGPALVAHEATFDPYDPNVVVLVRTRGASEARAALARYTNAEHLRLLAREQRLSIDPALTDAVSLQVAIVEAAERRIANRRAAAS